MNSITKKRGEYAIMQLIENTVHPLLAQDEKILSGLFAELGTLNQNGRRYPETIYEQAYEELIPKIRDKRLLGELDHPIEYDEVRLSNVSHVITECEILEDGGIKKVYGTVELLDTPAGMIAQSLVKAGIPLGISSRGLGATKQVRDGAEVTQLKLITYDLVAEPSFANAILSPEKSHELSDSLHYIESKLPLNESIETQSVRDQIQRIRESLLDRQTKPVEEVDINKVEIDSLKELLESTQSIVKSDTKIMTESRKELKKTRELLKEANEKYKNLMRNMLKLQESYNQLRESSLTNEEVDKLKEELVDVRKRLATEKRGMSYNQVSELLEGANTEEDIENRLNSLSSLSRKSQSMKSIRHDTLTESRKLPEKRLTGLASIISKV